MLRFFPLGRKAILFILTEDCATYNQFLRETSIQYIWLKSDIAGYSIPDKN